MVAGIAFVVTIFVWVVIVRFAVSGPDGQGVKPVAPMRYEQHPAVVEAIREVEAADDESAAIARERLPLTDALGKLDQRNHEAVMRSRRARARLEAAFAIANGYAEWVGA